MEDSDDADRKYFVEGNILSFNSAVAADPTYFLESSDLSVYRRLNRMVGRVQFSSSIHERVRDVQVQKSESLRLKTTTVIGRGTEENEDITAV